MPELVALALPPNRRYVESIEMVWERGDAFCPIDPRLPAANRQLTFDVLKPSRLIELNSNGEVFERRLDGGVPVEAGDAVVLATSGTSGTPKAVVHTHGSVRASALATSTALNVDPGRDRWLACLPLAHIGGLSVVLRSLVTTTPVEVHDGFDAHAVAGAANRGATLVSLVTRTLGQIDSTLFRRILIGGASAPSDLPENVWATYGMTETGSGVVYSTADGQMVLDGCHLRTVDGPAGSELQIRGPMLCRGYRTRDGAGVDSPFTDDGWFPTGDLGEIAVDGTISVHGRRGDVIVTGGEKVWPEPVERLVAARPDVADVAVVGRPDSEWGQRVVAVVVPARVGGIPNLDDIRQTVKSELPGWCAPRELVVRHELPRTSLGKIQRARLAAELPDEVDSGPDHEAGNS